MDERNALRLDIAKLALPILVERLGGEVSISEEEAEEVWRRYGGRKKVGVKASYQGSTLTLTLVATPGVSGRN